MKLLALITVIDFHFFLKQKIKYIKIIYCQNTKKYTNLWQKSRSFSPYKKINESYNSCACQLEISVAPSILHTNFKFFSCSSGHNLPRWKLEVIKTVLNVCFQIFNAILKNLTHMDFVVTLAWWLKV